MYMYLQISDGYHKGFKIRSGMTDQLIKVVLV